MRSNLKEQLCNNVVARALLKMALAITAFCPLNIDAQGGGPPMITDDTETVPTRHWEINAGITIKRGLDGRLFGAPVLDINYGLGEHVQVEVEQPWFILHNN